MVGSIALNVVQGKQKIAFCIGFLLHLERLSQVMFSAAFVNVYSNYLLSNCADVKAGLDPCWSQIHYIVLS
jgi:hypothetical protein